MAVSLGGLLDQTPITVPILLIAAGVAFLFITLVERFRDWVHITRPYQKWMMGLVGAVFFLLGLWMYGREVHPPQRPVVADSSRQLQGQTVPDSARSGTVVTADRPHLIFTHRPSSGYDMGVNTSAGLTDWVRCDSLGVCMDYPPNQDWGAVFVTVGKPRNPPRPSRDLSAFKTLAVELRGGAGGESVWIGIKDNTDPDDGSETKLQVTDLSTGWTPYKWSLSRFSTADLHRVYSPVEFVFDGSAKQVWFRNVTYLP